MPPNLSFKVISVSLRSHCQGMLWNGRRILVWNMEDAQNGMEDLKNGMEDMAFHTSILTTYYIQTYNKLQSNAIDTAYQ